MRPSRAPYSLEKADEEKVADSRHETSEDIWRCPFNYMFYSNFEKKLREYRI